MNQGEEYQLRAEVGPDPGTAVILWKSNATSVTVNSEGLLTARSPGNATITARHGEHTAKVMVLVRTAVTGLILNEQEQGIIIGGRTALVATVMPLRASNKTVTWESSNTNIVLVNRLGIITGVSEGRAEVTATTVDGGFQSTISIVVGKDELQSGASKVTPQPLLQTTCAAASIETILCESAGDEAEQEHEQHVIAVEDIEDIEDVEDVEDSEDIEVAAVSVEDIEVAAVSVEVGAEAGEAEVSEAGVAVAEADADATTPLSFNITENTLRLCPGDVVSCVRVQDVDPCKILWISSDPHVSSVTYSETEPEAGANFNAIACGSATITAIVNRRSITINIVVTDPISVSSVSLNTPASSSGINLKLGSIRLIKTIISPEDATDRDIIWSSSNMSVATVSEGLIHACNLGQAKITATSVDGQHSASICVTVK
jgi:uncharacterized protein YjdB